jgi:signal transduction histidine kinase
MADAQDERPAAGASPAVLFAGDSVHAAQCRAVDWAATPLGAVESWSISLRNAVAMVLAAPSPTALLWGSDFVQVYNVGMAAIMADKHPWGLGRATPEVWPEVWPITGPVLASVLENGEAVFLEDQPFVINRRGYEEEAFFTFSYSPVWDDDGSIGGVLTSISETTQRRNAEAELRHTKALLEGIAQGTDDLIAALDPDFRFTFFNEAYSREFRRLWGQEPALGMSLLEVLAPWPGELRKARSLFARAIRGESFRVTAPFGPSDAEQQYYDLRFSPVPGAGGELLGGAHILRNVTEFVRTQEALREGERTARALAHELARERSTLAAVIENLPIGLGIIDVDGRVISMNPAAFASHGEPDRAGLPWQPEEYLARFRLLAPDGATLPVEDWPVARAQRGEFVRGMEVRLVNTERGTERTVSYDSVPVRDEDGAVALMVFVIQDVTAVRSVAAERERLLAEADSAREAAERSSTVKTQFLSVISHELRTPLTAVLGYTDLLDADVAGPINARQKEYLSRIRASTAHLVTIIDEILTFSRSESGREEVRLGKEDVASIARSVLGMLAGEARTRGLGISLDGAAEPMIAITDGGKVSQIMVNLVGNALKYTPEGHVRVELESSEEWVDFHVHDTGPGIPADRQDDIFEAFVQLDQSNTRTAGGTGLGLAICRKLSRMLGGDVTVRSEPGAGSSFTFRIPRRRR